MKKAIELAKHLQKKDVQKRLEMEVKDGSISLELEDVKLNNEGCEANFSTVIICRRSCESKIRINGAKSTIKEKKYPTFEFLELEVSSFLEIEAGAVQNGILISYFPVTQHTFDIIITLSLSEVIKGVPLSEKEASSKSHFVYHSKPYVFELIGGGDIPSSKVPDIFINKNPETEDIILT